MIRKFVFGQPVDTGAVVQDIPVYTGNQEYMMAAETEDSIILSRTMAEDDIVYGLGEQVRGINKRGFSYVSYAADDPVHTENKHSLYGAHNFMVLAGQKQLPSTCDKARSYFIFRVNCWAFMVRATS